MSSIENFEAAGGLDLRKAALLGGLALPAVAAALDVGLGSRRWPRTETVLGFVGDETPEDTSHVWFGTPPLGWESSEAMGELIGPALDSPMAYIQLPQRRPSMDKIGEEAGRFFEEHGTRSISIAACSWGGILACNLLPYLPENITLKRMMFINSPTGIDDARIMGNVARMVHKYPGGPISSFLVAAGMHRHEAFGDDNSFSLGGTLEYRARRLGARIKSGMDRVAAPDKSAWTYTWQLGELVKANPLVMQDNVRARTTDETEFGYIMPDDPARDVIVNVIRSAIVTSIIAGKPLGIQRIPDGLHVSLQQIDEHVEAFRSFINGETAEFIDPNDFAPLTQILGNRSLIAYSNEGIKRLETFVNSTSNTLVRT